METHEPTLPFRLGVNYWPARSAMRFWRNWNEHELRCDFSRMRSAGLDCVRLFLTWEDFQPSSTTVSKASVKLLARTLDLALAAGIEVMPTFFTGHMSGANFLPAWTLVPSDKPSRFPIVSRGQVVRSRAMSWYDDHSIKQAQIALATQCSSALSGHPALMAWDLGNENSNCVIPQSKESAADWLHQVTSALRSHSPGVPITAGIHMEDLEEDRNLGPEQVGEFCDFLTMHGYPGYAAFTDGPTDARLLPFLSLLTRYLGHGKEIFFTEFGVPTVSTSDSGSSGGSPAPGPELVTEDQAADYISRCLVALRDCGATGAMMWCHTDYSPELFTEPPFDRALHERSFGLFRADGTEKPAVAQVRAFAALKPQQKRSSKYERPTFIDITRDEYYMAPRHHLARLFRKYNETVELT